MLPHTLAKTAAVYLPIPHDKTFLSLVIIQTYFTHVKLDCFNIFIKFKQYRDQY